MSTGPQLAKAVHQNLGVSLTAQAASRFLATETGEATLRDDVADLVAHVLTADLHTCGAACLPADVKAGPAPMLTLCTHAQLFS